MELLQSYTKPSICSRALNAFRINVMVSRTSTSALLRSEVRRVVLLSQTRIFIIFLYNFSVFPEKAGESESGFVLADWSVLGLSNLRAVYALLKLLYRYHLL